MLKANYCFRSSLGCALSVLYGISTAITKLEHTSSHDILKVINICLFSFQFCLVCFELMLHVPVGSFSVMLGQLFCFKENRHILKLLKYCICSTYQLYYVVRLNPIIRCSSSPNFINSLLNALTSSTCDVASMHPIFCQAKFDYRSLFEQLLGPVHGTSVLIASGRSECLYGTSQTHKSIGYSLTQSRDVDESSD